MRRAVPPFAGLVAGAVAGALWGWFGGDGYEAADAALGTGLLGAVTGLLIGAVVLAVGDARRRKRR